MDTILTNKENREAKEAIQKRRLLEAYRQAEALLRELYTIEAERRFLGDWETNKKLQAFSKVQLKALVEINAAKEELSFVRAGLRDNDLFAPV